MSATPSKSITRPVPPSSGNDSADEEFRKDLESADPHLLSSVAFKEFREYKSDVPEIDAIVVEGLVQRIFRHAVAGNRDAMRELHNIAVSATEKLNSLAVDVQAGDAPPPQRPSEDAGARESLVRMISAHIESQDTASGAREETDDVTTPWSRFRDSVHPLPVLGEVLKAYRKRFVVETIQSSGLWPVTTSAVGNHPRKTDITKLKEVGLGKFATIRPDKNRGAHRQFDRTTAASFAMSLLETLDPYRRENRLLAPTEESHYQYIAEEVRIKIEALEKSHEKSGSLPFYESLSENLEELNVEIPPLGPAVNHLESEVIKGPTALTFRWQWLAYKLPRLENASGTVNAWAEAAICLLECVLGLRIDPEKLPSVVRKRVATAESPESNRRTVKSALREQLREGFASLANERLH